MTTIKGKFQDELPVIDLELGAKLLGANQDTAKEMIAQLAAMLPEDLTKIQNAFVKRDYETLKNLAHYVKGGASYCGTPRLKYAAAQMEELIHNRSCSNKVIETAYHHLCAEINNVITQYAENFKSR